MPVLITLPLTVPQPDPYQPRTTVNVEADAELIESIRQNDILQPPTLRKVGGGYQIGDGHRRVRCAIAAGLKEATFIVLGDAPGRTEQTVRQWHANEFHEKLTVLEKMAALRDTRRQEPGLTNTDLAKTFNLSLGSISQYLSLAGADQAVHAAVKDGLLGLTDGYELSRLPVDQQIAAVNALRAKPKRGRKPKAEATERVKRITCQLGSATVTVAQKQLDIPALIKTLKGLLKQATAAAEEGVQIGTFAKLLEEKAGKAVGP